MAHAYRGKMISLVVAGLMLSAFFIEGNHKKVNAVADAIKTNIVVILMDDLDKVITEPYFKDVLPHMSALNSEGIYFENAFAPTALCCPARASILTGKYAHNTGVLGNQGENGGYQAFRDKKNEERTIAVALHESGYITASFGKYLNGYAERNLLPPQVPPGWSIWSDFAEGAYYSGYNYGILEFAEGASSQNVKKYGHQENDYSTDVLTRKSIEFIASQSSQQKHPFFIYLAPTAPHSPMSAAPRHQELAKKWKNYLPIDRPNYFSDGDTVLDKPYWLRKGWDSRNMLQSKVQEFWFNRMGSLYAMNEMIGSIVRQLKEQNLWDHTLLIVTSDNGFALGAHRLLGKKVPYEESIRVPLIVAGGKHVPIRKGKIEKRAVLHCDFAPTLLDIAGVPIPEEMDGRSFLPILHEDSDKEPWRKDFLIQFGGDRLENNFLASSELLADDDDVFVNPLRAADLIVPPYRGLRGAAEWVQGDPSSERQVSYVEWFDERVKNRAGEVITEYELYDLDHDPYQLDNLLYSHPEKYRSLRQRLHQRLEVLKNCTGRACR
jgi:arylsulfatase A-like enzyme